MGPASAARVVTMRATFDLVTIDAIDPERLAAFWVAALDLVEVEREDGNRWIVLADGDRRRRLGLQRGVHRAGGLHLDVACGVEVFDAEHGRLLALGAREVGPVRREAYAMIVNLADPDGNPFDLCAYQ